MNTHATVITQFGRFGAPNGHWHQERERTGRPCYADCNPTVSDRLLDFFAPTAKFESKPACLK